MSGRNFLNEKQHRRLIKKIDFEDGVSGRLLAWINICLTEIEQRTHVRGIFELGRG